MENMLLISLFVYNSLLSFLTLFMHWYRMRRNGEERWIICSLLSIAVHCY